VYTYSNLYTDAPYVYTYVYVYVYAYVYVYTCMRIYNNMFTQPPDTCIYTHKLA